MVPFCHCTYTHLPRTAGVEITIRNKTHARHKVGTIVALGGFFFSVTAGNEDGTC